MLLLKPIALTKCRPACLKSRVALFEGTWEKYHAGTARVPKGPNWPGEKSDYLKDFTYDANTEISYFLGEAMKEATNSSRCTSIGRLCFDVQQL